MVVRSGPGFEGARRDRKIARDFPVRSAGGRRRNLRRPELPQGEFQGVKDRACGAITLKHTLTSETVVGRETLPNSACVGVERGGSGVEKGEFIGGGMTRSGSRLAEA